ncbi:MAG TPA: hypothetical protein VFM83_07115, partial [Gaiellaceae bacterium]|nr:hypothetical protein [Gaiellaceae bacterium]
ISRELDAQATARSNGWGARVQRAVKRRPGRTALALAAVAGAVAAALFVSSPWKSSPGFLEQVQAAVTPRAGTVLHFKLVMTENRAGCKVTHPPIESWADLTPPYNWRAFDVKQTDICKAGTRVEIGAEGASRKPTLVFVPPNTLATTQEWPNDPEAAKDPYGNVRRAIDNGTAHDEGRTAFDGRPVERIRIDCDEAKYPGCDPTYWYVDPETFLPVRTLSGPGLRPGPGASCTAPCSVQNFLTYEYLPGTPANRALADLHAQHPDATEP